MKAKEKQTVAIRKSEEEMVDLLKEAPPFVFEDDKKLIEELARQNRYIRGLFNRVK